MATSHVFSSPCLVGGSAGPRAAGAGPWLSGGQWQRRRPGEHPSCLAARAAYGP